MSVGTVTVCYYNSVSNGERTSSALKSKNIMINNNNSSIYVLQERIFVEKIMINYLAGSFSSYVQSNRKLKLTPELSLNKLLSQVDRSYCSELDI